MNIGHVVRIVGPVLDVRFPDGYMPPIHNLLYIRDGEKRVAAEVAQHLDGAVRLIALEATEGLSRGLEVEDTGHPVLAPVGSGMLGRAIDVLGKPIDGLGELDAAEHLPIHRAAPFTGSFMGYERTDGRVGIRNEIWILPLVGCVNHTAQRIAAEGSKLGPAPVYTFPHPYGCSQLGEDHANTRALLAALVRHPNAGGVLVLSLGCENNTLDAFKEHLGPVDEKRVKFLVCQEWEDEEAEALKLIQQLQDELKNDVRTEQPISKLVVGLKCGGSDGFSGITANPLLGAVSDGICAAGGTALLTEVPEMFGAESLIMGRCRNEEVFKKTCDLINGFKKYYQDNHMPVYENPSPGNKATKIPLPATRRAASPPWRKSPWAAPRRAAWAKCRTCCNTPSPSPARA